ncbi:carbon-nitrogen hydrolase family protein [Crossiella cryophila]|uniref:nitrilase-related carbon-nitrogen hydrolase n=1 Tax=Crossiella cryophila TaxID=43355 RepID=UPI0031E93254
MRIACWQAETPASGTRPGEQLDRLAVGAARAAEAGAALLITPELYATGYPLSRRLLAEVDAGYTARVGRIAAGTGVTIVHGLPEVDGAAVYNVAAVVTPERGTVASYRKAHLYGEHERAVFTAGDEPLVQVEVDGVLVGLAICYDVEFPEVVRAHALAGTQLLAAPTALAGPWRFVPETLVAARAFESQLYLAYVNWAGGQYCGRSRLVDPHGQARAAGPEAEELLLAEVDLGELAAARAETTYLTDRRPELYR